MKTFQKSPMNFEFWVWLKMASHVSVFCGPHFHKYFTFDILLLVKPREPLSLAMQMTSNVRLERILLTLMTYLCLFSHKGVQTIVIKV